MDPISIALSLAKYVPSLIGWFTGDKDDEKKAEGVISVIKQVTGLDDEDAGILAINSRIDLQTKFKSAVMDYQLNMEMQKTKQMQTVNKTMRVESKSEHFMQWAWRPFNGFTFGISLFLVYVLPALINMGFAIFHVVDGVDNVPRVIEITGIPEFVLVAWGAVLGVTAWQRGKEKLAGVAGRLL